MPFPESVGDQLTFAEFQKQTEEWRNKNFDEEDRTPWCQLLGVVEEVGELSHAELKHKQRIRGMEFETKFDGEAMDAVGDILVYLAGYCSARNYSMQDAAEYAWAQIKQRDWKADPNTGGQ